MKRRRAVVRAIGYRSRGYLAHDGLLAGVAASLLSCVDSLAAHIGLEVAEHRIQLVLLDMSDDLGGVLAFSVLRLIMVSRVCLGDVDASLLLLGRQRTLRALGSFVRLRVRGVGHRLMLMGTAVDLQRHVSVGHERKKIDASESPPFMPRNCDQSCRKMYISSRLQGRRSQFLGGSQPGQNRNEPLKSSTRSFQFLYTRV